MEAATETKANAFALMMKNAQSRQTVGIKRQQISDGLKSHDKKKAKKLVQLCLDLGQKNFGPTLCDLCGMTYTSGVPEDDQQHKVFHARVELGVPFKGWKNERILLQNKDLRIISVDKKEFPGKWKLLSQILEMVHRDLGGCPVENAAEYEASRILLAVSEETKRICGCLIQDDLVSDGKFNVRHAEYIFDERSEIPQIKLYKTIQDFTGVGIQKLWVHDRSRCKGIARHLLTSSASMAGGMHKLAFTELTPSGFQCVKSFLGNGAQIVYYTEADR